MNKKILTLCIVHTDDKVLLGMKKRGFGEGKWNGFGGKVEKGESIEEAARRELLEEAGIHAPRLTKQGILAFEFKDSPQMLEVHVFGAKEFEGEPRESEEMRPQWFPKTEVPFHSMWPDDIYWFPHLFANRKFAGGFFFSDEKTLDYHTLKVFDI